MMKLMRVIAAVLAAGMLATFAALAEPDLSGIKAWEAEVFGDVQSPIPNLADAGDAASAEAAAAAADGEAQSGGAEDLYAGVSYRVPDEPWMTILINRNNPIPDDWEVGGTATVRGGEQVSRRILPALQAMFNAARDAGVNPEVNSGYRTKSKQEQLLKNKLQEFLNKGESQEDAKAHALEWVAMPEYSEHVAGLGVDIRAGTGSKETVYQWLADNSWKFGFVLRYPEDKVSITGINNEPWHYRYVGTTAAVEMHNTGECLEEYVARTNATLFRDQTQTAEEEVPMVTPGGDSGIDFSLTQPEQSQTALEGLLDGDVQLAGGLLDDSLLN